MRWHWILWPAGRGADQRWWPPAGSVLDTSEEQWRGAFDSVFWPRGRRGNTARHAPDLCIAWVLSTSVEDAHAGTATSNGFRPGLGMLIKQLADELGPQGSRWSALCPVLSTLSVFVSTSTRSRTIRRPLGDTEAFIPLRRYGTPEEFGQWRPSRALPAAST